MKYDWIGALAWFAFAGSEVGMGITYVLDNQEHPFIGFTFGFAILGFGVALTWLASYVRSQRDE